LIYSPTLVLAYQGSHKGIVKHYSEILARLENRVNSIDSSDTEKLEYLRSKYPETIQQYFEKGLDKRKVNYCNGRYHGGFLELNFNDDDKPYLKVFGVSGDYGAPNHHDVVSSLNKRYVEDALLVSRTYKPSQLPSEKEITEDKLIGKAIFKVPAIGWAKLIFFEAGRNQGSRGLCR